MAKGRPPKPLEQREAEGNLGNRELAAPLRTGKLSTEPPAILEFAGAELWVEMTSRLGEVIDQIDRAALTAMCVQWDRATAAAEVLEAQGHYARGSMGQLVAHPALAVERNAQALFLKYASEYAATPSARARVQTANQVRDAAKELETFIAAQPVEIPEATEIGDVEDADYIEL